IIRRPLRCTLFPYTTLFRSKTVLVGTIPGIGEGHPALQYSLVETQAEVEGSAVGGRRSRTETGRSVETHAEPTRSAVGLYAIGRSEEHTSELQSLRHLVCRL